MRYYGYEEFLGDMKKLVGLMGNYRPEALVAVTRGGMTMAHLLAEYYGIRKIYTVSSVFYEGTQRLEGVRLSNIPHIEGVGEVLIIDEIVDSGKSLAKVTEVLSFAHPEIVFKTAVLFHKEDAELRANYYVRSADEWVEFFWEADLSRA